MKRPIVYVVHCVDTEGPLYQSTQAICELLKSTFNVEVSSKEEILALQKGNCIRMVLGNKLILCLIQSLLLLSVKPC